MSGGSFDILLFQFPVLFIYSSIVFRFSLSSVFNGLLRRSQYTHERYNEQAFKEEFNG
jgi:hypothetical protein